MPVLSMLPRQAFDEMVQENAHVAKRYRTVTQLLLVLFCTVPRLPILPGPCRFLAGHLRKELFGQTDGVGSSAGWPFFLCLMDYSDAELWGTRMPPVEFDAGAFSPPFSAQRKRIKKLEAGAKSLEDGHRILLVLQDAGQPSLSRMPLLCSLLPIECFAGT
jgi:hypothetical protein